MRRLAWALWLPFALAIAWQILASAGLLSALFFPAPWVLLTSAAGMVRTGELVSNAGATLGRTAAGFVLGSSAGLIVGLLMGAVPRMRLSLEPIVSALNATPKLSVFPLLMLLLGIGESSRLTLIALTVFVITSLHALDAVRNLHPEWVEMAVNYGAGRWALFRIIYLPACLPQVFTGLRLALANALVIAISCELVNPSVGLGSMIWLAWQTFSTERLYVAILVTATLGGALHASLRLLEKRLVPWKAQHGA